MHAGEVVDARFTLEALRGAGGMGQVYRARDGEGGGLVALKVLHRGVVDRLGREVAALMALSHPAIVRYVASGVTSDGRPYLAMEWLDGEDLAERLARGPLSTQATVVLVARVSAALAAAHSQGIVHRDIKPENIFLPGSDVAAAKVLDFGIARLAGMTGGTLAGAIFGTPGYMAPEQARGFKAGPAADVFSLGCVTYECLAGRRVFLGDHPIAVMAKVLFDEPPRLASLRIGVAPELDALLSEMLSKEVSDRPPDGAALVRRLAGLAEQAVREREPSRSVGITRREQELVSVILASSPAVETEATLDASGWEDLRRKADSIVAGHGGHLDAVLGGALVATVSGRGTLRDHAFDAARCALELQAAAPQLRVVLATGARVAGHSLPVGEVIDRCAALLRSAADGSRGTGAVLLDVVTARLLGSAFDVAEGQSGLFLRGERDSGEARVGSECVGRERELGTLAALLTESASEPVAAVALLVGPVGIGKTRLLQEALARVDKAHTEVWYAAANPLATGSPFALVARAVRYAAGIRGEEPANVQLDALAKLTARYFPNADRVGRGLAELCGLHREGEAAAARADEARRGFEDLVSAACRERPLVLAFEDVHWADPPSIRVLEATLRRMGKCPLFLVATARPEVVEALPRLWAGRAAHEIQVGELGRRAAERLLRARLGGQASSGLVDRILERAAGNAFFLEELARASRDHGGEVPATVVGVVQARLHALDGEARRVLRAASIFGQTFSAEGVAEVLGCDRDFDSIAPQLEYLVEHDVLVAGDEGFGAGPRFMFAHALVQDAAYSMLTPEDRTLGHALAGGWMERRGVPDPVLVAHHLENGGERTRAAVWHQCAANEALAAGDAAAAKASAERGLGCSATGELRGWLAAIAAEASMALGELEDAERRGLEALSLVPRGSPAWHLATRASMARAMGGRWGR